MSSPRMRHTARGLLVDEDERLLLARHDLRPRQDLAVWAPPGGKLEDGESPRDALRRELLEEVGLDVVDLEAHHVWHREVVSPLMAMGWDGTVADYFLVRCRAFTPQGEWTPEQLASEDITEFRWWSAEAMVAAGDDEVFGPPDLGALVHDLVHDLVHGTLPEEPVLLTS